MSATHTLPEYTQKDILALLDAEGKFLQLFLKGNIATIRKRFLTMLDTCDDIIRQLENPASNPAEIKAAIDRLLLAASNAQKLDKNLPITLNEEAIQIIKEMMPLLTHFIQSVRSFLQSSKQYQAAAIALLKNPNSMEAQQAIIESLHNFMPTVVSLCVQTLDWLQGKQDMPLIDALLSLMGGNQTEADFAGFKRIAKAILSQPVMAAWLASIRAADTALSQNKNAAQFLINFMEQTAILAYQLPLLEKMLAQKDSNSFKAVFACVKPFATIAKHFETREAKEPSLVAALEEAGISLELTSFLQKLRTILKDPFSKSYIEKNQTLESLRFAFVRKQISAKLWANRQTFNMYLTAEGVQHSCDETLRIYQQLSPSKSLSEALECWENTLKNAATEEPVNASLPLLIEIVASAREASSNFETQIKILLEQAPQEKLKQLRDKISQSSSDQEAILPQGPALLNQFQSPNASANNESLEKASGPSVLKPTI